MNVVVLNTVLSNTGDAAIYQAILHTLSEHGIATGDEVRALDSAAEITGTLYPQWNVLQQPTRSTASNRFICGAASRLRTSVLRLLTRNRTLRKLALAYAPRTSFFRSLRAIAASDLIVSSGGTYLVDHYDFRHRVAEIAFARSLGKPILLWTQSLGPFKTARAQSALSKLAPLVDGISFRDSRSAAAWKSVESLPPIAHVAADAVFSLYSPHPRPRTTDSRIALISVRDWDRPVADGSFSFDTYSKAMRELVRNLTESGWRCIAISTCQGVDGYSINDSQTARRMFSGLDIEINTDFHTPDSLMEIIRAADLVVATRMHMAIMSLISSTPVIAIAYETKSLDLFKAIDSPTSVTPIEEVTEEWARKITTTGNPTAAGAKLDDDALMTLRTDALTPGIALNRLR